MPHRSHRRLLLLVATASALHLAPVAQAAPPRAAAASVTAGGGFANASARRASGADAIADGRVDLARRIVWQRRRADHALAAGGPDGLAVFLAFSRRADADEERLRRKAGDGAASSLLRAASGWSPRTDAERDLEIAKRIVLERRVAAAGRAEGGVHGARVQAALDASADRVEQRLRSRRPADADRLLDRARLVIERPLAPR